MRGRQRAALLRRCWARAVRVALTRTTFILFDEKTQKWTETSMERREQGRRPRSERGHLLESSRPLARLPRSQKKWYTFERRTCELDVHENSPAVPRISEPYHTTVTSHRVTSHIQRCCGGSYISDIRSIHPPNLLLTRLLPYCFIFGNSHQSVLWL